MNVIPGEIDADRGPPMAIPLRHFLVGLGFLLAGGVLGVVGALGLGPGLTTLAHLHALLAGWVCVTIMGAMTQFVPVWSGTTLRSRRLARLQLWLVGVGLLGFVAALLAGALPWLAAFGALVLCGIWVFVYNVGRTLAGVRPLDVTERHFAFALGCFVLLSSFGLLLAIDFARPVLASWGLSRPSVVAAHATLAVFGAVLATVFGALYQLATMFTQTELGGLDVSIQRFETFAYPVGVVALAGGRLLELASLARLGGVLIVASVAGIGVVLARRLHETRVDRTPMLTRYAVAALAMVLWALLSVPAWLADPLAREALLGTPGSTNLLVLGVVGFVVCGTLYHVVPFIVWVNRYSDLLGFEPVPMIDDLYDDRIAATDVLAIVAGTALLVVAERFALAAPVAVGGGLLATLGFVLFVANLSLVVHEHAPSGLRGVVRPPPGADGVASGRARSAESSEPPEPSGSSDSLDRSSEGE